MISIIGRIDTEDNNLTPDMIASIENHNPYVDTTTTDIGIDEYGDILIYADIDIYCPDDIEAVTITAITITGERVDVTIPDPYVDAQGTTWDSDVEWNVGFDRETGDSYIYA